MAVDTPSVKRNVIVMLAVATLGAAAACTQGTDPTRTSVSPTVTGDTWLTTGAISPSGRFRAVIELEENWMAAVSIVETASGTTVFEVGSYSRSRNHRFGVGWLSTEAEQLWVYSGDAGCAMAGRSANGEWGKSSVARENLPAEVKRWG